ncbi:MAG: FAD-dependent oxidoreductase [Alphaproteobacteria bacterium]|nr:FAD-dependent oxidoreductase [Alphaproteobacteria bacterium]
MPHTLPLHLSYNLSFEDLYSDDGLAKVDVVFQDFLKETSPNLCAALTAARTVPLMPIEESNLIIALAPILEDFLSHLFNIKNEVFALQTAHNDLAPLVTVKRQFVQRYAVKKYPNVTDEEADAIKANLPLSSELEFAKAITAWQQNEDQNKDILEQAAQYAAWATLTPNGQQAHKNGVLFKTPEKLDFDHLIHGLVQDDGGKWYLKDLRKREGFALTDAGVSREQAVDQANYCIWCHKQGKDSCSKGLKSKTPETERFQKNHFGTNLTGCPLEEKISEMNKLKSDGYSLGALATAIIDNPMVASTGHRICNDCMKSCIYQKQEPVNIPGVETQTLNDILDLPWGFEIYSLLTRWNPLNFKRPLPLAKSGKTVLVAGMGPAGFTLAHHLMNDGHMVVGVEGLKIEPLPSHLNGVNLDGSKTDFKAIYSLDEINEPLDERILGGFGGVAEYGITVRWNKNFLKIIRLLLERRSQFSLIGGVRLGGTLTIDQAFELGFDHVALCLGAGSPTLIDMENALAPGVRQASDFLMALQLTGAAKKDSLANLQVRLPVVVIGGGLTAIDTATEAMAYYPVQVKKFAERYNDLTTELGEANVRANWTQYETELADEMLDHARQINDAKNPLEVQKLVQAWGGANIVYRRDVTEAPSYTLNHEEVALALQEGISILDHATPVKVNVDQNGYAISLTVKHKDTERTLPARSILVAAGTKPNTNLRYDTPDQITLNTSGKNLTFQAINQKGDPVSPERLSKPQDVHVLIRFADDNKAVSFFGDLHPSFAGNVVKAMGSAKQGYPVVSTVLKRTSGQKDLSGFLGHINSLLRAQVEAVHRLTPNIVEVVVKAPLAAKAFKPGQFYRLQNFESLAPVVNKTRLAMEGLALTGASVDPEKGLLSTIVLEMGGSSDLCKLLKPGEPVVLMGPTGEPTEIPTNETVLLIGGGLGNAVLFSIGQNLRAKGCKVLYFAGYKKLQDRYKVTEIEEAADQIIWCSDEAPGFTPGRSQDLRYVGNIVNAIEAYAKGDLGKGQIPLDQINRLIVIGSDRMMAAVTKARHTALAPYLNPRHIAIGSINSPMQCMMKEICAQCLQIHKDPLTGEEKIVYSCANQDQLLDRVDFECLNKRLSQNSLQEKLTHLWIGKCLTTHQKQL